MEHYPRRKDLDRYAYLKDRVGGQLSDLITTELRKLILCPRDRILHQSELSSTGIEAEVTQLVSDGQLGVYGEYVFHIRTLESITEQLKSNLSQYLSENPHIKGVPRDMIRRLLPIDQETMSTLLEYMVLQRVLSVEGDNYDVVGRGMTLKGVIKQAYDQIMTDLAADPFKPPTLSNLAAGGKHHKQAIKFILDTEAAYKCGSDFLFLTEIWNEYLSFIRDSLNQQGQLGPAGLRDRFDISRKWVIPILEETVSRG